MNMWEAQSPLDCLKMKSNLMAQELEKLDGLIKNATSELEDLKKKQDKVLAGLKENLDAINLLKAAEKG